MHFLLAAVLFQHVPIVDQVTHVVKGFFDSGINYDPEVILFHHMEYTGIHDQFSDFIVPLRSSMQFVNGVPTTDYGTWA